MKELTQRPPEQVTEQLIDELRDPTLFVRGCILKGTKYISQCNKNLEIAINHVNEQLEKKLIELGQIKTIYSLCQELENLEKNSKSVSELISTQINSMEMKSIPIIQQYESMKESIIISKRLIQIQDLCNRAIDFISLFNRLKAQFGMIKVIESEDKYKELFQKLQNGIPDTISISKTSKMIVELENMINFNSENSIEYGINSNEVCSLEFIEELQEEIKCLRKLSAIYRQHGHKKLVNGIENMDIPSIGLGCLILHQFNELWEHIDTFVDIKLKKIQHYFSVSVLQNCIEINDKSNEQFIIKTEFVTISILTAIERVLNHITIFFKQFICLQDTIIEKKLKTDHSIDETNFILLFWERSSKTIESVFNIVCTINNKQINIQNNNMDEIVIVGGSISLELILQVLINSYPEISNMFVSFMKNINTLLSSSPSKVLLTKIIDDNNIYSTTDKIKEKYLEQMKNKFNFMFDSLLPTDKYIKKNCDINETVSQIINFFFREIKIVNIELKKQICDLFRKKLLCFIVSCETIIQSEGGIIPYSEYDNIKFCEDKYLEDIVLNNDIRMPLPSYFHKINAEISHIAGLFSIELENILHKEALNDWDEVEKYRTIELLKSLQYKSVGRWFSHTSLSILNVCKNVDVKSISNELFKKTEDRFIFLSQKIINNFVQEWLPILNPINIWYKCLIQLSRSISIIFLINFVLRVNLDEKSCFSIADEIVIFQSIISHLLLDQRIKNDLNTDIKMIQDFRRILFSDLKSIIEAINSITNNKMKYSSNTEILVASVKEINPLLFSIHILNRIYFNLKDKFRDIHSFVDFSKITYYKFYNTLASIMFKKLNCNPTCDSDSDLFVIFDIFTQNSSAMHNNQKEIFSLVHNYVEYLKSEISKSYFNSDHLDLDDLIIILNFVVNIDSFYSAPA